MQAIQSCNRLDNYLGAAFRKQVSCHEIIWRKLNPRRIYPHHSPEVFIGMSPFTAFLPSALFRV